MIDDPIIILERITTIESDVRVIMNDMTWIKWFVRIIIVAAISQFILSSLHYKSYRKNGNGNNKKQS